MRFSRADLADDLRRLRRFRFSPERAVGDNLEFEERVCDLRLEEFETHDPSASSLDTLQATYFRAAVQGARRDHVPVTFTVKNAGALYEPEIEPNQVIVRLECIDDVLKGINPDFADLEQALKARPRDEELIGHVTDEFANFPGARPAFVAFKSEVASDLNSLDWLVRLRNRMGLGHYDPAPGQRQAFALMEYLVKDVLSEWQLLQVRGAARPFALPTVLDSRTFSPYFFPSPRNLESSFAVDLDQLGRNPIREMLHVRITYRPHHLVKAGELIGPLPSIDLAAVRDVHLERLRNDSGRDDFGATMTSEVEA